MEGLMLKLKLQYFGHLVQTANSLEKSLMLGKMEGRRRRGHQRMRWLDGIIHAMDMNLGKFQEMMKDREAWRAAVHAVTKRWTRLGDWTTISSPPLKSTPKSQRVTQRSLMNKTGAYQQRSTTNKEGTTTRWVAGIKVLISYVWLFATPPTRFLCPWGFPGKNIGVGCHSLLHSRPKDWTQVSCVAGRFFNVWATREIQDEWVHDIIKSHTPWVGDPHTGE